ncbi:MAG: porin [Campylobacterota bacterium]|nr:porin [Campylobacterota bacterium]
MKLSKLLLSTVVASMLVTSAYAGPKFEYGKSSLELFGMVQVWGMSTISDSNNAYADSSDLYIRRGRLGVKGKYSDQISYKVWFAYDNLGKNGNNILMGTPHDDTNANKDFYIWDAYFTYKFDKELANVTMGYLRPQVGKESITSGFTINSYEKGLSNFYVRKHIVGRGPGREVGVNIGGLTLDKKLNYNFGIFNPNHNAVTGAAMVAGAGTNRTSASNESSWMAAGRVAYTFGDAEMKKYKLGYTTNYFGKRNGTTIGLNYTYQGQTDKFDSNSMASVDILSNYGNFNLSYEWDALKRDKPIADPAINPLGKDTKDIIQTLRVGYNIDMGDGQFIEPALLWSKADLDDGSHFKNAKGYGNGTAGSQTVSSIGLNWYRNKMKEKYSIHYVNFDKTEMTDGYWDGTQLIGGQTDQGKNKVITITAQYIF